MVRGDDASARRDALREGALHAGACLEERGAVAAAARPPCMTSMHEYDGGKAGNRCAKINPSRVTEMPTDDMSPHCDPNCDLKRSHPAAGSEVLMGCRGIAADGGNTQTTALEVGRGLHSHRRPLQRGALTHRRRALSSTVRHGEGPTPQVWASACARGGATGAIRRARREAAARLLKTQAAGVSREIREVAGARHSDSRFNR